MTFDELMGCYYVNELDSNKAVYDELVKKLKRHNLTPIIGAGLSCWAYPLWGKLLTDMAKGTGLEDEVDNLLKEYKYEDAASLIEEEYGKKRFLDFLRKKFDPEIARKKSSKRPQYQELIPQIFRGAIITTNFDHAIEHLFELNDMEQPMLLLPHQCERIEQELRAQGSVLVKLHGDVNYWQELVLTKDAYNKTYGDNPLEPDMNKPMPEALAKILKHNPALFLGCSLNTDRTYHVIKSCADSGVNFALLSLPDETENEAEPYKPHLRDDGKLKSVLRSRINELYETLRIKVIWYPCGNHHTEALSAFFSKLAEDIGVTRSTIGEDDRYTPLHTLLGRDDVVKDIADKLSGSVPTCAWVWGTGGIGKTEVCRAVRAKLKDFEMPYIDITEVDNLPAFYQTVADETGISIDGIGIKETGQYLKERLIEKYANSSHRCALYFDNWEDIWYGSENRNEDDELIKWMKSLIANKVRLLVSSREDAPNLPSASVKPFEIKELDGLNSRKLFCEVLGRDIAESERETFDYLIKQLEDHPLAIVLTASQAHDEDIHLDYIKNRWENAEQDIPGGHEQHKNLAIAMQMSWNAIKDNRAAVIQWGLHYYSVGAIPYDVLQELRGDIADEIWRKGSKLLRKASLTNTGSERKSVSMLLPVKKQFDKLIKSDKQIQEDCLIRWAKYIEKLLDSSNELSSADRMIQHQLAVDLAPQIFYVMKQLMTYEASSAHQYLNSIVLKARNYYQFSIESVTLLEELKSYYKEHSSSLIYATVLEDYGDLLRRLGDVDGAKEAYDSAEPLYRQERANLGLANLLQSRGDLLRRLGDLDGAKKAYDSAEPLYKQERANLDLAHLLLSRGDLLRLLGDLDGAKAAYDSAEPLYRQERHNLSLAYLLLSRGNLLSQLNDVDGAKKAYNIAEPLFRQERANVGLANLLRSRGCLLSRLGDVNRAKEAFDSAEPLYRQERSNLGLANLLRSRGDLQRIHGQPEQAYTHYRTAEKLYREVREPIGLILSLAELYECCMRLDRLSEADSIQKEAREMLELDGIPSNVKGYVLRKLLKEY